MTFYRKSTFWSNQDWILYLFIVFGGSLIFSSDLYGFLFSLLAIGLSFGLYFGVNVFTKRQLYSKEISLDLGLDLEKKELQIGSKIIKFKSIVSIKFWYIYRIGWKMLVETKKQNFAVISPDIKLVVSKLKEVLGDGVFNNDKKLDLIVTNMVSGGLSVLLNIC